MRYVPLIVICIVILGALLLSSHSLQNEMFEDIDFGSENPSAIFKRVRSLLDKYDKPEVWGHAAKVMTMDPGELARMQLGVHN